MAIVDSPFPTAEVERRVLSEINAEVSKFRCENEEDVINTAKDAHAILCDLIPITRRVISSLEKARVMVVYGIGYDSVDVKAASERGILVCNVPDFTTYEVADHTLGLILALIRKIPWAHVSTRRGEWGWKKLRPILNLDGKKAGIVGFGRVGRQVTERLRAFKVNVVAYDPYVPDESIRQLGVRPVGLRTLLTESDIVTVHTVLTEETRRMIGEKELRSMKTSAILVNTSRGAIIDQRALYKALENKWISAAALDVLEREPPDPGDPLLKLDNVIISPHIGWYSEKSMMWLQRLPAEEVVRVLTGKRPKHPINPEVISKW